MSAIDIEQQSRRQQRAKAIIHKMSNADMRNELEICTGSDCTGMTKTRLRKALVQQALDLGYNIPIEDYDQPIKVTA